MHHQFVQRRFGRRFGTFTHEFPGNHILGSVRHTPAGMRRWFQHLPTIFPDLRFEVQHV